ncbi:MAG: glycoside hydrolase family 43 protein [Eubacteriales bacterium]|nr:glycoside hydrolase family 43 protein [Eubacteriales bacterium]
MKKNEINIRDPYVLLYNNMYYLYGTRSETCWGPADGFDCYTSRDLENWEGPFEIFHRPEGFFADSCYWAPECICIDDSFYLITTFGGEGVKKGIYVLRSESPVGPFQVYSERITPGEWTCIDGTVHFEDGIPWLIYSRSFEDDPRGYMVAQPLQADLKKAAGEPVILFDAAKAPWANPVPFAKFEFGIEEDCYFTDGPGIFTSDDRLYMTWSSWGTNGYAVGVAVSDNRRVTGPWRQLEIPIWPENGGHGMTFLSAAGERLFALHYPNDKLQEHPVFMKLTGADDAFRLENI